MTVLKTVGPARVPWVRIPPPPPTLLARFDTWRVGRVGRRRSPAKRVYWLKPVSRVRIPCSPPIFFFGKSIYALVAQLDRVSGYEPEGRRFESARAHQNKKMPFKASFCFGFVQTDSKSPPQVSREAANPARTIRFDRRTRTRAVARRPAMFAEASPYWASRQTHQLGAGYACGQCCGAAARVESAPGWLRLRRNIMSF